MSHEIALIGGKRSFAYVGAEAWHGLGQRLEAGASMEAWAAAAGLNFEILSAPVRYETRSHGTMEAEGDVVLYRSDNGARVGIVSDRYQIVQPMAALEFFREFCEAESLTMETAGALKGGSIYWALAKTGREANFGADVLDVVNQYVLLSTSADGSRSTDASINSTRVVCRNTLRASDRTAKARVKTRHSTTFDANATAKALGLVDLDTSWEKFAADMRKLQDVAISPAEATAFFSNLLRPAKDRVAQPARDMKAQDFATLLTGSVRLGEELAPKERAIRGLADLETSYVSAPGAVPGTAYGVLQAVTHFVDHVRGTDATRQASAMFGQGDSLKSEAFEQLLAMA